MVARHQLNRKVSYPVGCRKYVVEYCDIVMPLEDGLLHSHPPEQRRFEFHLLKLPNKRIVNIQLVICLLVNMY